MKWSWRPYRIPDDRSPGTVRDLNLAIIEHLSELDFSALPSRSTSAGEPPMRGCCAKQVPDECKTLYPSPSGQCLRPFGAVPPGVTPAFLTDTDGRHPFCPYQVQEWKPSARVQVSHESYAPNLSCDLRIRRRILTFLRRTVHSLALSESEPIASAARYYAPRTLHEHVNGTPVPAPGEALALELAERIRQAAVNEKPWQKGDTT